MIKRVFLVLIVTALIPFYLKAGWVFLNKNTSANIPPKVTLLSDDNNSSVIRIDISGFDLENFNFEGKSYNTIDLLSEVFSAKPGFPELPYISKILAIPDNAGISVEVTETSEVQIFKDIYLRPARESWFESEAETSYIENSKAYQSDDVYPQKYVSVDRPAVFRDFRIARVSVFPVRYIAARNELQVVSSITIRINYGSGTVINPKTTPKREIAPSFAKLYRSFIFNYENVMNNLYKGKEGGHEVMLCIMPDEFVNTFQPYAEWKRLSGTDVHITKFSDIGANSSNPNIIKDHITDAYHNWEYPPTYVLIVGDDGVFPKKIVTYDYSFANEDFFVEIDGDDFFPEMMIGRLTNQGDYGLQVMLNKFLKYEKEPYTESTDWFKKATCCSNNDYISQVKTKRFAAQVMMEDGEFTSVDTLMSNGNWGGGGCSVNLNDVIYAINDGRSYLNYRGEGWSDGWHANCYNFSTSNVSSLNNGEKLTFVTSIGCGVAMFDSYEGNCFGEEWLELGSIANPKGAVAFVGPTSNTHTTYNNKIDKGIYIGMFREGMDTPGQALLRGKLYMYNYFGNDPWVEYQYRIFCVLGDPGIHIWKDVPYDVNVSCQASVPVGYSQPEFTVTFVSSGLPVANAEVCLSGDDIFSTGFTDSTGKVHIGIEPETTGTLSFTVRGGNVIPYTGSMDIIQTNVHVGPAEYPEIAEIDGNADGLINPNENATITISLKNWGIQTANNVQVTLSIPETDLAEVVTTNPVSFGNISPGGSATGDPLQFYIKSNCPVGQFITLQLHVESGADTWDYQYSIEIFGCELIYNNYLVNDAGSTQRNYRMDPGETVDLFLTVNNIGDDFAPNVMGVLRTNDPYITIVDSIGLFGTIDTNSMANNMQNKFEVSIDLSCPVEYEAQYSLKLLTQDGNYSYETLCDLTISVGMPRPIDYTGPDAYGYYAYSNIDTIFEQAPAYDWFEIIDLGTQISLPQWSSEYTETVDIPFVFKYYSIDYEQVRISTDGWIAFGNGTQTAPDNTTLPHNDNINCMVGAFWDDLYNPYWGNNGKILYYDDNTNHRFIIEWSEIMHNNEWTPVVETFQIVLLDPAYYTTQTGDGEIIFQYKKVSKRDSNTIGIENDTEVIGLQYAYNGEFDSTAAVIAAGTAIKFTTEEPYVNIPVSIDEPVNFSNGYSLRQNYPNPFNSGTTISYSLPKPGRVTIKIFNINGELVYTLHNNLQQTKGEHSIDWDGFDNTGNSVAPGFYFYRLSTEDFIKTMKMFKL